METNTCKPGERTSLRRKPLSDRKQFCILEIVVISNFWGDPDVDGRMILRWIFRKWEGVVGTGWGWLRIGTGGGHL